MRGGVDGKALQLLCLPAPGVHALRFRGRRIWIYREQYHSAQPMSLFLFYFYFSSNFALRFRRRRICIEQYHSAQL